MYDVITAYDRYQKVSRYIASQTVTTTKLLVVGAFVVVGLFFLYTSFRRK